MLNSHLLCSNYSIFSINIFSVVHLSWPSFSALTNSSWIQAAAPRSTTVILVKNLPAGVTTSELEELFSMHGSLGRVLLPPSGLTAIIEFLEPTEAKRAFKRLAYSKVCRSFHQQKMRMNMFKEWKLKTSYVLKNPLVSACPVVFGVGTWRGVCGRETRTR